MNSMDTMERYRVQESIKDAIAILDSAPIHRDLIPETNLVQLTNRVPIAHLAIERGLKALIVEAGGPQAHTHGLHKLYQSLKKCDQKSADYLATAFEDAVSFFGYNVNTKGFKQFRSLDEYLSKVGTEKAFELLRYWAIGETGKGESPVQYISPPIHRELLCALWCLFLPTRRDTVSERVENEVRYAMFDRRHIYYSSDDRRKKQSVCWYMNWLFKGHPTRRSALEEAARQNFAIRDGDEFVKQTLVDAHTDLRQSKDPAVIYFLITLTYLPKGSQIKHPDAVPGVQWFSSTGGKVVTPADTCLGFVEKYADGAWGIEPQVEGLARVTAIAKNLADAKAYLVNRLTKQVTVTVNGESKQLRIVSERDFFPLPAWTPDFENSADLLPYTPTYDLEFWNVGHGIRSGDEISVELPSEGSHEFASVLEGRVITVAENKVSVTGMERLTLRDAVERLADDSRE